MTTEEAARTPLSTCIRDEGCFQPRRTSIPNPRRHLSVLDDGDPNQNLNETENVHNRIMRSARMGDRWVSSFSPMASSSVSNGDVGSA